ncbi:MAG: hypothetical protein ACFFC7_07890 [Candidatus Hermodarchaeota archaeon]
MKLVKIGGSVIAFPIQLRRLCDLLNKSNYNMLIVPGGGPFADTVRETDSKYRLKSATAHWMAILGMDQFALLLSDLLPNAQVIEKPQIIKKGLAILRPAVFLEKTDPLPHSWDVTSDSITAYFAHLLNLNKFVKITVQNTQQKSLHNLVDPYLSELLVKYSLSIQIISIFDLEKIKTALLSESEK